jgi:nitroreductase
MGETIVKSKYGSVKFPKLDDGKEYKIGLRIFSKKDLMEMPTEVLRAVLRERTHHTIEVYIWDAANGVPASDWLGLPPTRLGDETKPLLAAWVERGLPIANLPDVEYAVDMLWLADEINSGRTPPIYSKLPEPFSDDEMKVVEKLIKERRSIRRFKNKDVEDWKIMKILEAGVWAPVGCNTQAQCFMVIDDMAGLKLLKGDIPLHKWPNSAKMIVVCQDARIYTQLGLDRLYPQNIFMDAAACADHMLLMAHALGLGGCWLTHTIQAQAQIRKFYSLPDYIIPQLRLLIGYAEDAPLKSQKMPVQDQIQSCILRYRTGINRLKYPGIAERFQKQETLE